MGIRQPGMKRRQPDLGAVADQQEDEGEVEQRRIEAARRLRAASPGHRRQALAQHRLRREIDQDGAEEGERDADAAEDEIFPGRLDRLAACDRCRPSSPWSASPASTPTHIRPILLATSATFIADIMRLEHRVVEAQEARRQPAGLDLVADVAGAEDRGREGDEGVEHDEDDVEVVDEQIVAAAGRSTSSTRPARRSVRPRPAR